MDETQEPSKSPKLNHPFPIERALKNIETAIAHFKKAALFELAEDGYGSTFQQIVACMISVRTRDETTIPVAKTLFAKANHPSDFTALKTEEIAELLAPSTFARTKAANIKTIAALTMKNYGGELPCDEDVLLSLPGIGPKCTNLVMGIACGKTKISVDIHVHRVCNRWGYVSTRTPEHTLSALESILPQNHWVSLNRLLVPFGKHICTGNLPKCSTCPVNKVCEKVGVEKHR